MDPSMFTRALAGMSVVDLVDFPPFSFSTHSEYSEEESSNAGSHYFGMDPSVTMNYIPFQNVVSPCSTGSVVAAQEQFRSASPPMSVADYEQMYGISVLFVGKYNRRAPEKASFSIVYADRFQRNSDDLVDLEARILPVMVYPLIEECPFVDERFKMALKSICKYFEEDDSMDASDSASGVDFRHVGRRSSSASSGARMSPDPEIQATLNCVEMKDFLRRLIFATNTHVVDMVLDESPVFVADSFRRFMADCIYSNGLGIHERTVRHLLCSLKSCLIRHNALKDQFANPLPARQTLHEEFFMILHHIKTIFEMHLGSDGYARWQCENTDADFCDRLALSNRAPSDILYDWAVGCVDFLISSGCITCHDSCSIREHYESVLASANSLFTDTAIQRNCTASADHANSSTTITNLAIAQSSRRHISSCQHDRSFAEEADR
eukprot:ANDGO_00604.mRNA.1 hypothetical protein